MTFFSPEFGFLFLIFLIIYWSFARFIFIQKCLILLASYGFIISISQYFALILGLYTCFVFFAGRYLKSQTKIEGYLQTPQNPQSNKKFKRAKTNKKAKALVPAHSLTLAVILSICVIFLSFFKYYDYVREFFGSFTDLLGLPLSIAFPLGISYYTFMSITYLTAMYKNECKGCDDFLSLACFLGFFPTIVMGPISRAVNEGTMPAVLPQFNYKKSFKNADEIFTLMIFASVKLLIISGYLTPFVGDIFAGIYSGDYTSGQIIIAILLYGVALYANFSGFIDLVRALALALGFELAQNFDMPYSARNIKEFWRRWHITLTSFITQYIYIPLGGSKLGFWRTQLNVMIAFVLSGVWHGVGYGFFVWGLLHGLGLVIFNIYKALKMPELNYYICVLFTYIYVSIAWVFFANDFEGALEVFIALSAFTFSSQDSVIITLICIGVMFYKSLSGLFSFVQNTLFAMPLLPKALVLGIIWSLIIAIMPKGIPSFIYASF